MLLIALAHVAAIVLILAGLVVLPLPIPLGAIMILLGVLLVVTVNPNIRRRVRRFRQSNPKVERVIRRVQLYLPRFLHKPLRDSAPNT